MADTLERLLNNADRGEANNDGAGGLADVPLPTSAPPAFTNIPIPSKNLDLGSPLSHSSFQTEGPSSGTRSVNMPITRQKSK